MENIITRIEILDKNIQNTQHILCEKLSIIDSRLDKIEREINIEKNTEHIIVKNIFRQRKLE